MPILHKNKREELYDIIFESDTPTGKLFDVALLGFILISIFAVMLESVHEINQQYGHILKIIEWGITIIFTLEYILRILISHRTLGYVFSFYGIIDFLSVLPSYLGLFIVGSPGFIVFRALRLLRIFRILKLNRYISESQVIITALKSSRRKISVFLYAVVMVVLIIGTLMYLVESPESGFTSIPRSVYWAIVTLTTVGYGDIAPQTTLGQFIAGIVMVLGYSIIAVPTGIVTAELSKPHHDEEPRTCPHCFKEGHSNTAKYCDNCGGKLQ